MNSVRITVLFLLFIFSAVSPVSAEDFEWDALGREASELYNQGYHAGAIATAEKALKSVEAARGAEHPDVTSSLSRLADMYRKEEQYAQAEPLYIRLIALKEKALGPNDPALAISLDNFALLYVAQGKFAEAERLNKRALEIFEKTLGPDDPDVAISVDNLAHLYRKQGDYVYAEAERLGKRALKIFETVYGPDHIDVAICLENLAILYRKTGRVTEAAQFEERVAKIRALTGEATAK